MSGCESSVGCKGGTLSHLWTMGASGGMNVPTAAAIAGGDGAGLRKGEKGGVL
jgi:hypothetical protein